MNNFLNKFNNIKNNKVFSFLLIILFVIIFFIFCIFLFKDYFNENIPDEYKLSDNTRKKIIKYDRIDMDSEGIYPISLKNWELIHAKNNKLPKDKFHRSSKNLAKTKQLYPDLYEAIKDKDISVNYSTEIGEHTEQIKKLNF